MDIKQYAQMMKYLTRPKETALDIGDEDYGEGPLNTLPKTWLQTMPELEGAPDPDTSIKELATGGVATPKRGLVDEPGSYSGTKTVSLFAETGNPMHKGIQKTTYPSGTVSYRGGFTRTKTGGRQTTPFRSTIAEARADLDAALAQPKLKTQIELQAEKGAGNQLDDPKYKKELQKAFKELKTFEKKGYIDLDAFRNKYKKKFELKAGSKDPVTGRKITSGRQTIKTLAISQAISDRAKELKIYNLENPQMHKALDAYAKIKNRKPGDITRLAKQYKVNLGHFNNAITTFKLREYLPKDKSATRLAQDRAERAAIKKYSSSLFEQELSGTVDIQKSHMGDKYNMPVKTSTIDYAPGEINKFLANKYDDLKIGMSVDAVLKKNTEKLKSLYKNKPAGYKQAMDRLNQKGTEIAMATRGFKKFESIDPNTGKTFVIEGAQRRGLDPTGILGDRKLSDLDKTKGSFDREMVQYLKKDAMKDAKMSKPQIKKEMKTIKDLLGKFEARGCGKAAGGRILFSEGSPGGTMTKCAQKGVQGFINDLKKGNYSKATKDILKGGGQFLKGALNPMDMLKLRNLVGPAALGFMAAYEGGAITNDVINKGTPLNEALADNWLTKSFLPYTQDYAKAKNLLETGKVPSNMKKYVKDVMAFNDALKDVQALESNVASRIADGTVGMIDGTSVYTQEQEDKDRANVTKKLSTITEDVVTPGSGKALEMKSLQEESEATRLAKKGWSPFFGFDKLEDVRTQASTPGIDDYMYVPEKAVPKDLRPITYQDYERTELPDAARQYYEKKYDISPGSSLSDYSFPGSNTNALEELTNRYNISQASNYPGYYGANNKFMEGGIASLNVKKK